MVEASRRIFTRSSRLAAKPWSFFRRASSEQASMSPHASSRSAANFSMARATAPSLSTVLTEPQRGEVLDGEVDRSGVGQAQNRKVRESKFVGPVIGGLNGEIVGA